MILAYFTQKNLWPPPESEVIALSASKRALFMIWYAAQYVSQNLHNLCARSVDGRLILSILDIPHANR